MMEESRTIGSTSRQKHKRREARKQRERTAEGEGERMGGKMVGGRGWPKKDKVALLCVSCFHIYHRHIEDMAEAYSASC